MKFSYFLLKKLAPNIKNAKEVAEALTLHAFEVESVNADTIDIALPANRYSDAASHFGVARLLAAILNSKFVEPALAAIKSLPRSSKFSVKISTKNRCSRYGGLYVELGKVKDSPDWLQKVLISCGLRPINAVVDIMNYVMLEIGQPMHAFDYDKLAGGIVVRLAKRGEKIITLDGDEYVLGEDDLVIADDKKVLAIAGIKGGRDAAVSETTKRVLVEAANFDAGGIYQTSRRLNLITDASIRFAHGLSSSLVETGIKRAAQLLKEIGNATIGDFVDVNYSELNRKIIKFDIEHFNRLTGLMLNEKLCLNDLKKLGFKINGRLVEAPAERLDIERFEDLVEEIVNLYGYGKLPSSAPRVVLKPSGMEDEITMKDKIKKLLTGWGLSEVYNYSFVAEPMIKSQYPPALEGRSFAIELQNPVAEDKKYLRPSLMPMLIKNIEDNWRFYDQVRIFEIGRVFQWENKKIKETPVVGLALGYRREQPFLELKGLVTSLLEGVGLTSFDFVPSGQDLRIESDHRVLGYITPSAPNMALAEIDLAKLTLLAEEEMEYEPLPKYPSVMRDISFWINKSVRIDEIMAEIQHGSPKYLIDVDLVDWYEPSSDEIIKLKPSRRPEVLDRSEVEAQQNWRRRSLTFRLVFNAKDRTLTDEEVGREVENIISVLRQRFDIELR